MFKYCIKIASRNLQKQLANSLINLAGLSIGMAAAILIFLWVENELTFDNYHIDSNQIFLVKDYISTSKNKTSIWEYSPYLLGEEAKEELPEVNNVCRLRPVYDPTYFNINGQFSKESSCAYIDSEWLNVFKYEFIYGNKAAFNNNPFSLLLTTSKAKKYFGNENPIGKTIRIDSIDYMVQGVIKDNPSNSSFQYDVLIPITATFANSKMKENMLFWGNFYFITFLKLAPTINPQSIEAKLKDLIARHRDQDNIKFGLTPLKELRFENDIDDSTLPHGNKKTVYVFAILGLVLLVIACINYVNLTTARAALRVKEISIKKIIGADKKQLFAQFITESTLICVLSLFVCLSIVKIMLPFFNQFTETNFSLPFFSSGIWMIILSTLFITVVLNSLYPAFLLSSINPLSIFRGKNVLQLKDSSLRFGLVITQFTVSLVLVTATIVIYRQLLFINQQNASYNRSQMLSFSIPYRLLRKYEDDQKERLTGLLKKELLNQSCIEDVSLINMESIVNMQGSSSGDNNDWNGREKEFQPTIAFFYVDTSFKKIINLQMQEGRWYQSGSIADQHNTILNETAVKELNIHKPVLGQRFVSQGDTGIIIGVVKDFHYKSMHEKIGPVVIKTLYNYNDTYIAKIVQGKTKEAKKIVEKVWNQFFPQEPFSCKFLDDEFEKLYRKDRKTSELVWFFSSIAIFISCLGLFGLTAFIAEKRNKEISIRKILGAGIFNIISLLSKEFIYMILFSVVVAFPIAYWAMSKWLENFVYRINISWWIFLLAFLFVFLIALLTVSYQALKAAITNPIKSLRIE
jgi:ABC-type antimicrobial peptide transport system permease subunit